jgi:hypothetical protein
MAHPTDDSSRDIPKAGPSAVGFVYTRNIFRTHQRGSGQHSRIGRQRCESEVNICWVVGLADPHGGWFTGELGSPPKEMGFG